MRTNIQSGNPYEKVFGYCRAVRVGDTVHVAGTCAQPPHIEGCDAYQQAANALEIIEGALAEAGASRHDVVRTVTYVTDIADVELVARAHHEVFGTVRPAATLVEVSRLIDPAMKVEIEAYAIVDSQG
ncbi:MAG: RidA family protein [Acidimicrobiia bacterium]|nr:RidA family protein [Acidimicrobiia bacterium]